MKLKALGLALLLILLGSVSAGTLAYFTADEITHNVITSGGVDVELIEKTVDENGNTVGWPDGGVEGVMPGEEIAKIVSVKNKKGASPAWVRIKLVTEVKLSDGTVTDNLLPDGQTPAVTYEVNPKWIPQGGYYYYDGSLEAEEETEPIITGVTFDAKMGNEYQGCKAIVSVTMHAVQVANNGDSVLEAAGWPE